MAGFGDDFRGTRVLLTGATGFKGSWLAWWLTRLGAEVTGLALPATSTDLFSRLRLDKVIDLIEGDIRDPTVCTAAVARSRPQLVFHLAAQALVRPAYADPVGTLATNVMGTAHVLEAIRLADDPCGVVVVSSDKCYANREWEHGYRETDALGGHDPYSASKGAAEIVTASYRSSFFPPKKLRAHGIAVATARAGNVIGPGDLSPDRLVPDCVRAFQAGRDVDLRNPGSIRPWQHVMEPLTGYLMLAQRLHPDQRPRTRCKHSEAWNFGPLPGDACSVGTLRDALADAWGAPPGPAWTGPQDDQTEADAPHEAARLRLSIDKAQERLGWQPTWTFDDAIRWTAIGYRQLLSEGRVDPRHVLDEQIGAFVDAAHRQHQAWARQIRTSRPAPQAAPNQPENRSEAAA